MFWRCADNLLSNTRLYFLTRCLLSLLLSGTQFAVYPRKTNTPGIVGMAETSVSSNTHASMEMLHRASAPGQRRRQATSADPAFSNRLYAILDIHHLLDSFIQEIRKALPCDGIEYHEDSIKLDIIDGTLNDHQCCYTIDSGTESLGHISFTREKAFHQDEIDTLENMVAGLVLPLRNALCYQRAIRFAQRDELTGLRNCSYYYDNVELEIQRAQRYKIPFSLLLIDLDDFNDINNTYSHSAGDAVLVELARRLEHEARGSDVVFRNGGDEYLVFLPNTRREDAMRVAERIRSSLISEACVYDNREINLTLSIGVVTVLPEDTVFKLIDRGDKALFHAKILGKNRIHSEPVAEPVQVE
jgi:diguanylate cyclase (GGDEF)-like protein